MSKAEQLQSLALVDEEWHAYGERKNTDDDHNYSDTTQVVMMYKSELCQTRAFGCGGVPDYTPVWPFGDCERDRLQSNVAALLKWEEDESTSWICRVI